MIAVKLLTAIIYNHIQSNLEATTPSYYYIQYIIHMSPEKYGFTVEPDLPEAYHGCTGVILVLLLI